MMKRKYASATISVAITLIIWVCWSSNQEFNNTMTLLARRTHSQEYLIQPINSTCKDKPFLLIIVTSYAGHVELRSAHRRAMPEDYLRSLNAIRIFLLARIPINEKYITQKAIEDESNTFGDILQGSFMENYRNLTYKHLMGLHWAGSVCSLASYILKVDDDTVFNLRKTHHFLKSMNTSEDLLLGYMLNNTKPRRSEQNKWYVTIEEYSKDAYPPYLSGWYYITTPKVAARLSDEAAYHTSFWIDDIFVTGILRDTLGIKLMQLPEMFWLEYYELLECCLRDMIQKSIRCDHVVAPNGGRNNLIFEFNEAIKLCDRPRKCKKRPPGQSLNKNCVAYRERNIFSGGHPEVRLVTN